MAKQIQDALDQLAACDNDVARAIQQVGYPSARVRAQTFETFVSIIVSQQIGTSVAHRIMDRLRALLPVMEAEQVLSLPLETLKSAGLSQRKLEYLISLSQAVKNGTFEIASLSDLNDTEVTQQITALRGFGPWSAEIYLMFALQRPDVFPSADRALQVGLQRLKGLAETPTADQTRTLTAHWSPHRSAGALLVWHYYHGAPA